MQIMEIYNQLSLSLVFIASLIIWLKLGKQKTKLNLPPSPPKLPIIGNIHQLGKLPHRSLRDLSAKYGPLLLLQLGHNPTLVVSSADMVRDIVKNHDVVFCNRSDITAANILLYGCKNVSFAPYGEYWRQLRKIFVLEVLSQKRVQGFQFAREDEVELLINTIRRRIHEGAADNDDQSINLAEMMLNSSSNIISRCILTEDDEGNRRRRKFGELARRIMDLFMKLCVGDMFPYLKWVDLLTGYIPILKALAGELDAFLDPIIEEQRALKSHDDKIDFISSILQLQNNGKLEMDLTKDNMKAVILDVFVGATDTTATTVEWIMAELLRHPNIMKKVQGEVRNFVGKKSKIDADDINKMNYLKCVHKETLRLHPPAPLLLPRKTSASVELGGYDIPCGTTVFTNVWAIHRDPTYWENPEEFNPERFLNSSADFNNQDFHFIPFGYGRRGCPGGLFGVASIEYVTANLLYWFDWKLPGGQIGKNLDMTEHYGVTVNKKVPLHLLPIPHFTI